MCNFVARTNRLNIKSNYFVHTIIVFDLPYYTNVRITVTFDNQVMLCRAFFLISPENYPHKSGAIFHINLYMFYIHTENFLTAPTSLTMWSGWPSFKTNLLQSHMAEWIIIAITGISVCSPLFKTPFTAIVLNGFLLSMKSLSSTTWLLFSFFFFDLVWQTILPSPTASFQ